MLPVQTLSLPRAQRGITLIELMISVVLGLIVSAAAVQMLIVGTKTFAVQSATNELRDSAVYGLELLENRLSMAGLMGQGKLDQVTNDVSYFSALLITTDTDARGAANTQYANMDGIAQGSAPVKANWLSNTASAGVKNTDIASDQLTIQYQMQQDGFDCEGTAANRGDWVVERYFVRQDATSTVANTADAQYELALACDAGRLTANSTDRRAGYNDAATPTADIITLNNVGDDGVILLPRVDYFMYQVGVDMNPDSVADLPVYMSVASYLALPKRAQKNGGGVCCEEANAALRARNNIVAVKVALIARSSQNTASKLVEVPVDGAYTLLGNPVVLDANLVQNASSATSRRYIRKVYTTTVSLLNAAGGV